jgi:hypothetical protein
MGRKGVEIVHLPTTNLVKAIHTDGRWVDSLFDDYHPFPVIGDDPKTMELLLGESLTSKLFKVVLKRANLSVLVNSLTGLSLLAKAKDGNLIEEAYRVVESDIEGKKTIQDRIKKAYKAADKAGMAFAYVKAKGISPKKSPVTSEYMGALYERINSVDRKFVSVSGILCRIDRAKSVAGATIAKALAGSGASWVLADYPYFAMGQTDFQDGVLLLNMNQKVVAEIGKALPFWAEVGWYPYARVSGECRYPFSPTYGYPSITPSWIEYRTPKPLKDVQEKILSAYNDPLHLSSGGTSNAGFAVVQQNPLEVLTYIDVARILAKGANLDVTDFPWLDDVVRKGREFLEATKTQVFA